MNQEQLTISYDEYISLPSDERDKLFGKISVENCASLMRTHVERWLEANHLRLNQEQIAVIEEFIGSIKPESYQAKRNYVKVMQETEKLYSKAETVFSREDIMQFGFLSNGHCEIG